MTTGELIRILSHWCPDTTIAVLDLGSPFGDSEGPRELDIEDIVDTETLDVLNFSTELVITARF